MIRFQTELAEAERVEVAALLTATPQASPVQSALRRWPIYLSLGLAILVSLAMWAGIVSLVLLIL